MKKSLDEQIRNLESQTSGFKKAVEAQKGLQSELIDSQSTVQRLNEYLNAQKVADDLKASKVKPYYEQLIPQLQVRLIYSCAAVFLKMFARFIIIFSVTLYVQYYL